MERLLGSSGLGEAEETPKGRRRKPRPRPLRALPDRPRTRRSQGRFATVLDGKQLAANQVEFINLIINHLTEQGVMSADLLYESPFIDLDARGPDGLFSAGQVKEIVAVLDRVRVAALAQGN